MTSHAAVLTDVKRTYGRGQSMVHALRGVSIEFPAHSWTAIMGPSGSGKSTLLHCAAGLERVTDGRIELAGTDITKAAERELTRMRRTTVGFVFQSFNLMAALTAEQNVVLPFRLAGQKVPRAQVQEVLSKVGLADRRRHRPRQLSGGEQQRVALARALVTEPQVLFADEPTGALDSQTARTVLGLLRSMVDDGQTVAMVTHDPVTASYADTVVFLSDGQVHSTAYRPSSELIAQRLTELVA